LPAVLVRGVAKVESALKASAVASSIELTYCGGAL